MEEILSIAIEACLNNKGKRIEKFKLAVGQLCGVVPEALRFAFEVCIEGSIAEDATLEIEFVRARCNCLVCNREFVPVDIAIYSCPSCNQPSSEILQGLEFSITSLEIA
jgi:hydrogenase nickel incorporation protein HypA/HybF